MKESWTAHRQSTRRRLGAVIALYASNCNIIMHATDDMPSSTAQHSTIQPVISNVPSNDMIQQIPYLISCRHGSFFVSKGKGSLTASEITTWRYTGGFAALCDLALYKCT